MSKEEWKILFYTCTCEDNFMRLVDEVVRDENGSPKKVLRPYRGDEFPRDIKHRLFDIKLPDGRILEKCLVVAIKHNTCARAFFENGNTLQLQHGTELRARYDDTLQKKLEKIRDVIKRKEWLEAKVRISMLRKIKLEKKLAETKAELASTKIELNGVRKKLFSLTSTR